MNDREPFFNLARVQDLTPEEGRRILVISDIHGNLPYLKGVLQQVGFCPNDILIIDGDYMEKGPDSLGTLRYLMDLVEQGNTYVINGNCDDWQRFFFNDPHAEQSIIKYLQHFHYGIIYEMLRDYGIDPESVTELGSVRDRIYAAYQREWDFIVSRPHAIETPHYVFTHAGMHPDRPLREHTAGQIDKFDNFLSAGYSFPKWVIVGHWPVVLYGTDIVCASPIIERERRIISLDGGCVLKDDGQLNCLIIPFEGSEDFTWEAYDSFPTRYAIDPQEEGPRSYYIRWGDSQVRVLERGPEFSRCRHIRTGYEMDILTKYLFTNEQETGCNDCSDYILPLRAGDAVKVIEETSRGYYVKHNGTSGWYFGTLK